MATIQRNGSFNLILKKIFKKSFSLSLSLSHKNYSSYTLFY